MGRGPTGDLIPTSVQNHLGKGRLEKGRWNEYYLISWDFAEECQGKKCCLYDICDYQNYWNMRKEGQGKPGYTNKCMMQQRYLKNVLHAVMESMTKRKDSSKEAIIRMGYHMMPLYSQLFKMKLYEYANKQLVYSTDKGGPKVHPIYKEIREILKTIEGVWARIAGPKKTRKSATEIGDGSYIEAMYEIMGEEESEEEEEQEESPNGIAMDFEAGDLPDEKPKRTQKRKRKKNI